MPGRSSRCAATSSSPMSVPLPTCANADDADARILGVEQHAAEHRAALAHHADRAAGGGTRCARTSCCRPRSSAPRRRPRRCSWDRARASRRLRRSAFEFALACLAFLARFAPAGAADRWRRARRARCTASIAASVACGRQRDHGEVERLGQPPRIRQAAHAEQRLVLRVHREQRARRSRGAGSAAARASPAR